MKFFPVAHIVVANRPLLQGNDWQAGLLGFFEGLMEREEPDILQKPHLSLGGGRAAAVIRYEEKANGFFLLAYGGTEDHQDLAALNPYRVRGFFPNEALQGVKALTHYRSRVLTFEMGNNARLCLMTGSSGLIVGHTGLPSSLINIDSQLAAVSAAAVALVI